MKKATFSLLVILFSIAISHAQLLIGIVGGAHQASVIETNNVPGFDSTKNNYLSRTGFHFGLVADLPFGNKSILYFQPGIIYYNKGRKYLERFDPTTTGIVNKSATQYIDYIDMPLNLVLKFGGKTKFIIGGGPYGSFFYHGKETSQTVSQTGISASDENDDVPVGKKPGQYQIINYGVNGLAGLEMGRVTLTANYTRGFNDFYQALNYEGTFRHQTIGGTLGIFLGKPVGMAKKENIVKDKDKDGIPDKEDSCPDQVGTAATNGCPDKDGDGIADKEDKCPDVSGTVKNKGCPVVLDRDNDGVNDAQDKCPDVAGLKKYNGCPAPDSDKDGISDDQDKCPTVFGTARYDGCPVPDTDGDGINNEEDKCPAVKGTKANQGCPAAVIKKEIIEKVNYAAKRIQFEFSKVELMSSSFKVLNEVVAILKANPELQLSIEGHTSNDGVVEANIKLSKTRANKVKDYLQSQGIDASRLTAKGLGPAQPLNNGKTEAEKAQNRRVELKLSY